jgi:hypothetical protein
MSARSPSDDDPSEGPHPFYSSKTRFSSGVRARTLASRRASVVTNALEIVIRRIRALGPSGEIDTLSARAEAYLREVHSWNAASPPADDVDKAMRWLLDVHVVVAKLERQTSGDE